MEELRQILNSKLAEYRHASRTLKQEKQQLQNLEQGLLDIEEAQKIVQAVAQQVQKQAHLKITGVVSRCLQLLGYNYEFRINFVQKRGKTEADLVFVRDGKEIDPTEAAGGGPLEVASFALRLSAILLSRPKKRRLLVMDEPFKSVHESVQPRIPKMLMTLAEEMGFQFIFVTNCPRLRAGKVVEI